MIHPKEIDRACRLRLGRLGYRIANTIRPRPRGIDIYCHKIHLGTAKNAMTALIRLGHYDQLQDIIIHLIAVSSHEKEEYGCAFL
jgi:hypothetical protein